MINLKYKLMQNISEELFSNICNNLNFKNAKKLKSTNKNICNFVGEDILINSRIKDILKELKNFDKLKNIYTVRRNTVKLYKNNESLSILENYKTRPEIYDLEYHIIIVINDIFHNLELFKQLFLDKNKEYTKEELIKNILKIIQKKLLNNSLEKNSEILRDMSLLLLK